ncbi:DNA/RNA nuclease SfsA [candidate division KSB1 bacterium]|nr:DNA/RNA nuclease SfsA [candidate division KSB1 bacterium]
MDYPKLYAGKLLKRYKRFLADIELENGETITAHCPNSGSMLTCSDPGSSVWLSKSANPDRKYAYTLELVGNAETWIAVNTMHPNKVVKEAIENHQIPELTGYDHLKSEAVTGKSRLDLFLSGVKGTCYIEIKSVTLAYEGIAYFPDAVTKRGQKHLYELQTLLEYGHRCVMFYLVQRQDAQLFKPATFIDPVYSRALNEAHNRGVELLVYQSKITPQGIHIDKKLDFSFA